MQKHRRFPVNFVKFLRTPFYIERLWWLLLKTRKVFMQKQSSKGFFKKGVMRNFVEFARKHFPESPFFIKVNSVAFLNTRPQRRSFLQSTTRRLLLITAISIVLVMKGELVSETVNYDTETMYQFWPKCNLLRSTLSMKQHVSEADLRRF